MRRFYRALSALGSPRAQWALGGRRARPAVDGRGGPAVVPRGRRPGRRAAADVRARAGRMGGLPVLRRGLPRQRRLPEDRADPLGPHRRRLGRDRRGVLRADHRARLAVGPPGLGHLVDLGPKADHDRVLLLIYAGYLSLRKVADSPARRARWSAVVGVVGFIDVPIVHMSVVWWRSLHQQATVLRPGHARPSPAACWRPCSLAFVVFSLAYGYLMAVRHAGRTAGGPGALPVSSLSTPRARRPQPAGPRSPRPATPATVRRPQCMTSPTWRRGMRRPGGGRRLPLAPRGPDCGGPATCTQPRRPGAGRR